MYVLDSYVAGLGVPKMREAMGKVVKFMLAHSDQYQDSVKMYISFFNRKKIKGSEHNILSRLAREDLPLLYLYSKGEVRMEYSELDALYVLYLEEKEFKEFTAYLEQHSLPKNLFYSRGDIEHARQMAFGIIASLPKGRKKSRTKK